MTVQDTVRKIALHSALASVVWFAIALLIEKLIPGFISPFIDLPDIAGIVIVVGVVGVILHPSGTTRLGRLPSLMISISALCIAALVLWARINDMGASGIVLMSVFLFLSMLFVAAHLSKKRMME